MKEKRIKMNKIWNKSIKQMILSMCCVAILLGNVQVCAASNASGKLIQESQEQEQFQKLAEKMRVRGATIWPVTDIKMNNAAGKEIEIIKAGTPLKVLTYANGIFKIYDGEKTGFVDSNVCMINLPDIMQEEMQYDITNSYYSIYKIHGERIEGVTGEVLYPYVEIDIDEYLVPLLFPVAVHLYEAQEIAMQKGYTLKVYDAYRPYVVTKDIYAKTTEFVTDNPLYGELMIAPVKGVTYKQSNFLAQSVSNHNYGVAVDITLAELETGIELEMQSPMHELSTLSVLSLNNENANLLADIMLTTGFKGINSEWWHFEIRDYRGKYAAFQAQPLE